MNTNPTLHLNAKPFDAKALAKMVEKMTGNQPSKAEIEAMQRRLDVARKKAISRQR